MVVFVVYAFVFAVDADFAGMVMNNFFATFREVIPIIAIVFVVMFFLNLFIRPEMIEKHLGQDSGFKGWVFTLLGSVLVSGPPYVLMPMLADLRRYGMKTSLTAMFLSNRNVQPVFIPVMAYYFGWQYTLIVSFLIVTFSILNGILIGKIMK